VRCELSPGIAAVSDNVVVGSEDAVREPVLAHEELEVLNRFELRRLRRQGRYRDVAGDDEIIGHVPSCLVHVEDGMRIIGHVSGEFRQVLCHRVGITPGHDQRQASAPVQWPLPGPPAEHRSAVTSGQEPCLRSAHQTHVR